MIIQLTLTVLTALAPAPAGVVEGVEDKEAKTDLQKELVIVRDLAGEVTEALSENRTGVEIQDKQQTICDHLEKIIEQHRPRKPKDSPSDPRADDPKDDDLPGPHISKQPGDGAKADQPASQSAFRPGIQEQGDRLPLAAVPECSVIHLPAAEREAMTQEMKKKLPPVQVDWVMGFTAALAADVIE